MRSVADLKLNQFIYQAAGYHMIGISTKRLLRPFLAVIIAGVNQISNHITGAGHYTAERTASLVNGGMGGFNRKIKQVSQY